MGLTGVVTRDFAVQAAFLREHADAWAAGPRRPAPPRLAATVMLVRDGDRGVEVFMLRRVATMAFAPRMHVFPGGGVDPRDSEPALPWAGPTPADWARVMRTDEAQARELVVAAVREVFEECGVLLAGPSADTVAADVSGPGWDRVREGLLDRSVSLSEVLLERGLVLRSDLLGYRAHWVTPEFEPRRYDTRFFAALLPAGQRADDLSTESDRGGWARAEDVLQEWRSGAAGMLPPTIVSVEEIAGAQSAAQLVAERPSVAPVMPVLTDTADGPVLRAELPR